MLLVPRPLKIIIGTIDYSDCISSYDGGDEKLGYTSGLVVFRGKMTIGRALGFDTLDDRKNKLWNRGTPVKIYISDDFQVVRPSPRGGSLFVLSSSYSFDERTLTVEVGDSFALLMNREGKGDRTNICLGTATAKTDVINRLLAASGAPPLVDAVPGILRSPHPKLVTGSYIEQAGIIAAGSGYFLFMDSLNQTRASSIEIGLGTPIVTVDLVNKASNYKRITGENPAAWFVVNTNLESTDSSQYGFESTSEGYGPLAIAGVPLFGTIIIRREWQKESLSGNKRFVQTKVWEPIGAIIPLRKGQANLILSYDKLEIFEYESSAATSGTSASDICQNGNQGRLKTRTLTVSRPLGTVLDKIIQTATVEFQPGYLENLILALREVEEFEYGIAQTITIVNTLPSVAGAAVNPNAIPPTDPSTARDQLTAGLRHTLSRFEPAGAIAPEDFEWASTFALWIASASTHAQSYELVKEWTEARSEEWIAVERERVSFNRATPEAAAENRALIQDSQATANSYPRDLFCALEMVRNDRKVSSSGNTHPPAPDTIPSAYSLKSTPKLYKYKMPIDTDYPFRPKTQEVTIEYLTINGTLLAEKLGKISWGRFKGLSIQAEFSQDWWAYTPMCRVTVLEPSIELTGDVINTSAYLGDSWAISMSDGECAIGMDGIFLGFVKNNILIPPYVEVSIVDVVSTSVATIRSVVVIDPTPIISRTSLTSAMVSTLIDVLSPLSYVTVTQLSNTIRDDAATLSSGDAILNPITGYREAYKLEASWNSPLNTNPSDLAPYEVQIRKNGGPWSTAVFVPSISRTSFAVETLTAEIPGVVFLSSSATPYGYVGPGSYDLKVKTTAAATGAYSSTLISVRFPSPYYSVSIADLNNGNAIVVSQTLPVTATISAITSVPPVIAVKAGFPGYTTSTAINWTLDGPGSIVSTGPLTASFISGIDPYIDADSALLSPLNKESTITATIDGYSGIFSSKTIRPNQAELANTSTYAVTGIQLLGPNGEANSITVSTNATVTIGSIIQGTGNFPTSLNLVWTIVSGPGTIIQELYLPGQSGEHIIFAPASSGITQIKATAANGISATFSVIYRVASAVSVNLNVVSGQTFEAGSIFSVTATVTSTLASFNSAVNWQYTVATNYANLSQSVTGNVLTINVLSGDFIGEIASFTATSVQDPNVVVQFDIFTISKVTGITIVASKSSIGANETVSAQGYFTGIGRLTGPSTVGTQSFSWGISGPATLVNAIETFVTLTGTTATGTIGLSASVQGRVFIGNASISNTGVVASPTGITAVTTGTITYTAANTQTVYFPLTFANLYDAGNTTGIVISVGIGDGNVVITINLGAVKLIGQMLMGGGFLGAPWNNTTSDYLNLGLLEYSLNNVSWTKYATVSGVTDNLGQLKTYLPDVYAMYWRITRNGWVGMTTWSFFSRPIPPSPTSMVVAGLTWTLTYWDSGQSIQYGSLVEAAIVYVSIAYATGITSTNVGCYAPIESIMNDALVATLGPNLGWAHNSSCYVGPGAINNMDGVVRIFTKR